MRLELTGRHVDITPALRRLVDHKLAKLERLLDHAALSAQTVLTREKHRHRVEITLHARGEKFLHGAGNDGSWEASIGAAIDKLAQQAQRVKGKWKNRRRPIKEVPIVAELREAAAVRPSAIGRPRADRVRMPRIFRATRQTIRSMSVGDAAKAVDIQREGVVVFRDPETAAINVLYRRTNGELTLVETEA